MPIPKRNESEPDFVERCIPVVLHEGTAQDGSQASSICHSIFRQHHKSIKNCDCGNIINLENAPELGMGYIQCNNCDKIYNSMKTHPTKSGNHKEFYTAKNCHLEMQIKDIDSVGRTVCFIGNTLNYFDSDMDIIVPGAALKSITENGPNSNAPDKIRHAMFHDLTRSPGVIKTLEERTIDGMDVIYCESKLDNTTEGNDAMIKYLSGNYTQHSIGFQTLNADYIQADAHGNSKEGNLWKELSDKCINRKDMENAGFCRVIKEIKLFEVSTVAFGANRLTPTIGIKSDNKDAVMLNYIAQIDKLQNTIKSGGIADSSKKTFEIQILQLKQMLQEIFMQFGEKEIKRTVNPEKGFDYEKLIEAMG